MNLLETLQYTNGGKIQKIGKNKDSIEMDESEFPVIRNDNDYNQLKKKVIVAKKKKKKKAKKKSNSKKKRQTLSFSDLHLTLKFCYYKLNEKEEIINQK